MPKRDWHIIIGFGVLIGILTLAAFWHVASYNQDQREHREKASSYELANGTQISECRELSTDFGRIACLVQKISADQEQERGRADLHAQQDMSTWAVALLWASGIGILVSVAGIMLIYATLHETRAMTVATREIGENQSKAYVNVSSVEADPVKITSLATITRIRAHLANTGATPAIDIVIGGQVVIYEKSFTVLGSDREICRGEIKPDGIVDLPPKSDPQRVSFSLPGNITKRLRESGFSTLDSIYLRVEGEIKYWDVFENRYLTQFIFESLIQKGVPFPGMIRSSKPVECYKKIESRK